MSEPLALALVAALIGAMLTISWAVRHSTLTTLDFYLARRQIGPSLNAAAICGDYFSAASFLGVAGAVYASGLDGVWFATGFSAGFLLLLVLAAPLRRAGHFSIPDFLAHRFDDPRVRLVAVAIVQLVILMYLIPQMTASGLIWEVFVGKGLGGSSPYTTGIIVSATAIVAQAVVGGMKGTTWNQALQFGLKLFVIVLLSAIVIGHGFSYSGALDESSRRPLAVPATVPVGDLVSGGGAPTELLVDARSVMSPEGYERLEKRIAGGATEVDILVPVDNKLHPDRSLSFGEPGSRYTFVQLIALLVTLLLGTAGLPHIANRYFTSTTGRAARTATVWVLALAGVFYLFAVLLGVAARSELPGLVGSGVTNADYVDGIVRVPEKALLLLAGELGGGSLLALVSMAAFAAVFSTVAGLLLAAATSWGHDIYEQFVNPFATERRRIRFGQLAVTLTAVLAAGIALVTPTLDFSNAPSIALMVTWAFAVAGSAFTPLFVLAVWWKRTTAPGALVGMVVGAGTSLILIGLKILDQLLPWVPSTPFGDFPAIIAAPLAAGTTVAVSLLGKRSQTDNSEWWLRVHGTALERRHAVLANLSAGTGESP